MNPNAKKYAPPLMVLASALYMGWPPAKPLDLGDDTIKCKVVGWKVSDLKSPPTPDTQRDPFDFKPVQVAVETKAELPQADLGPSDEKIRSLINYTGSASLGKFVVATVNQQTVQVGDQIPTHEREVKECEVVAIYHTHIVVRFNDKTIDVQKTKRKTVGLKSPVQPATPNVELPKAAAPPTDATSQSKEVNFRNRGTLI